MLMAKRKLGTELPADVVTRFSAWVDRRGIVQWRAIEGALEFIQLLPEPVVALILQRRYKEALEAWRQWTAANLDVDAVEKSLAERPKRAGSLRKKKAAG